MSPLLSSGWHSLSGRARHLFLLILSHPNRRGQLLREWPEGLARDLNTRPGLVRKALSELQGAGFLSLDGAIITIRESPEEAPGGLASQPLQERGKGLVQAIGSAIARLSADRNMEGAGLVQAIGAALTALSGQAVDGGAAFWQPVAGHAINSTAGAQDACSIRASCGVNSHALSSLINFFINLLSSSAAPGSARAGLASSSPEACSGASHENHAGSGVLSDTGPAGERGSDSASQGGSGGHSGSVISETNPGKDRAFAGESGSGSAPESRSEGCAGDCSGSGSAGHTVPGNEAQTGGDPHHDSGSVCVPVSTGKQDFEPWLYGGKPFSLPSKAGEEVLSAEAVEELKRMYPGVVMETEIPRIAQYLRNNPHKRPEPGLSAMAYLLSNFINKKLERRNGVKTGRHGGRLSVRPLIERLLDEAMAGFGAGTEAAL